ncbi:MAG TPA: heme-binding protein [Chloroflexota bacterium]|nr:heme-binding protein [Chloroflexota bacterium]
MAAPLTLDEGLHLLQTCIAKMRSMSLRCSIAVVDAAGIQVAAARADGANLLSPDIAYGKAYAAAMFRRSGRELGEAWGPGHPVGSAMVARTGGRFVPAQGSLVLRDGDEVVGAIGVSGARSDQDEEIAQAGVDAFRR